MGDVLAKIQALAVGQSLPANTIIQRPELYRAVWSTPLRTLAPKLGYSDVGLRKACVALQIPLPGLGYWAKIEAGQVLEVPDLPDQDRFGSLRSRAPADTSVLRSDEDEAWLTRMLEKERLRKQNPAVEQSAPAVIGTLAVALRRAESKYDKLVADIEKKEADQRRPGRQGGPNYAAMERWSLDRAFAMSDHDDDALRVSRTGGAKALAIMESICCGLVSRGHRVASKSELGRVKAEIASQAFKIGVRERFIQGAPSPSLLPGLPSQNVKVSGGDYVLVIEGLGQSNKEFRGTSQALMQEINKGTVFETLYRRVVHARLQQRDMERKRLEWKAQSEREEVRRTLEKAAAVEAAVEQEKRKALFEEATQWHEALRLRAYLAAVRAAAGPSLSVQGVEWLAWAERVAADTDSLPQRISQIGDTSE
ncbi:MAG: hypothetical protein V4738_08045 [Pseudomonadota bacterium]